MIIVGTIKGIYLIFLFLALLINSILISIFLKKGKYSLNVILGFLFYENFGFIVGAKIFSYFANYPQYDSIFSSGISAYGALIGGFCMICIFCLEFKFPLLNFLVPYIVLLPLIYAIGKLGCFFGGCCYGIEVDSFICVKYLDSMVAPNGIKLFPVQLIESIMNLSIFLWLTLTKKESIKKIGQTFLLCSLSKFIFDFFRAGWTHSLSINQWVSIVIFSIGIMVIFCNKTNSKNSL